MSFVYEFLTRFYNVSLLVILAASLAACTHQRLPIATIYASNDCGIVDERIGQIGTADDLARFFNLLPRSFSSQPTTAPDIDFEKQLVLLYALGQKPNSGYGIELYHDTALLKEGVLHLPVRILRPDAKRLYAQVITSPCQLFVLPKVPFSRVVAEEDGGSSF